MRRTSNNPATQACRYVAVDRNDPDAVAKAHEAIAKEYAWNGRRRRTARSHGPADYVRPHDLERLYEDRYGARELPDDDSGAGDLFVMAHHLAKIRERPAEAIAQFAESWAPWATAAYIETLTNRVFANPLKWKADKLGKLLRLTDETRTRLRITTIGAVDCTKAQREKRRKQKNNDAKAAKRRAAGAKPRAASDARQEPWDRLGMSRATWFRKGKPKPPPRRRRETDETVSGTAYCEAVSALHSEVNAGSSVPATSTSYQAVAAVRRSAIPAGDDIHNHQHHRHVGGA